MEGQNPAPEAPPVTPTAAPVAPPAAAPPIVGNLTPAPELKPAADPPKANVVTLSLDEHQKREARLAEYDRQLAELDRKRAEAEQRAFEAAAKEGNATKLAEIIEKREKAEQERRSRESQELQARYDAEQKRLADEYARLQNEARAKEQRAKKYATDKALGDALGSWADRLAPNAFDQLKRHWKDEFSAVEEGDSYSVRATNGQSIAEFVNASLGSDYYANFLRAKGPAQGGTQHPGTNPSAAAPSAPAQQPQAPPQFANAGEYFMQWTKDNIKGGVNSATDMSKPIGLGRTTGLKLSQ